MKAVRKHRKLLDTIAEELIEKETIDATEVLGLLEAYDAKLYKRLGKTPPPKPPPAAAAAAA